VGATTLGLSSLFIVQQGNNNNINERTNNHILKSDDLNQRSFYDKLQKNKYNSLNNKFMNGTQTATDVSGKPLIHVSEATSAAVIIGMDGNEHLYM